MNFCVFSSSSGTVLQAIIEAFQKGHIPGADFRFVLVDREDCGAAEKAKKAKIPLIFLDPKTKNGEKLDREVFERHIQKVCHMYGVDLIVLAGWMRILSPWFVEQYPKKIINVHPSLLPKYPGMDMDVHRAVIDAGEKESGMTIHYVDEELDHGEIILQKNVPVSPDETPETLKMKVQALEKKWLPEVIRSLTAKLKSIDEAKE